MLKKKEKKINNEIFKKSIDFEADREYMFKHSEKRAWTITAVFGVLVLILSGVLVVCLPLKEVTPYVIQVNEKTGIPDVITVADPINISASEALDKYFINQYIQYRESYTYQTIQQGYVLTQLYSSDNVKSEYLAFMNSDDAVDRVMNKGTINVKVKSIILDDYSNENIATARIEKTYKTERGDIYVRHFVIKLSYEYEPKQKLQLSYRLENPLGFIVTSYQIVEENI